jgi:hypothetical protein
LPVRFSTGTDIPVQCCGLNPPPPNNAENEAWPHGTRRQSTAKRDLVAAQRPVDWEPPSILRQPEVLTEAELAAAEAELKALQQHAFEVVDPESR